MSIPTDVYQKFKEIAQSKRCSVAGLVEFLIELQEDIFVRCVFDPEIWKDVRKVVWQRSQGLEVRKSILLRTDIEAYKSTTWISEEYPLIKTSQLPLLKRIILGDDVKVQKIIIVPQHLWNDAKIWQWVFEWIVSQWVFKEKLQVFVVLEEQIPQEKKHVDTIIIGDRMVDQLEISETSEIISYAWIFEEQQIKAANDEFERLKTFAVKPETLRQKFELIK